MAIVFPSSPSLNDTYTVNGRTYVWNGTTWRTIKAPVPDVLPTLSVDNDFSAGGTFHVDSTNNEIGIGTGTPSHQLHLTQDLGVDGNLIVGGTITVPTPIAGTNDTTAATTAFVQTAVAGIVDSAPTTLDTLNELAAALGDDANFATTITNSIATKQDSSTALTTSTTFGGSVSGTYNNIVITDDSHTHDGRYFTETEADGRYLGISAKAADSNLFDGLDSTVFTRKNGTITSQDWNTYATGDVSSFTGVSNMTGSNKPPAYAYGLAVHYSSSGQGKLQIYAPHNGSDGGNGLWFRSGWNTEYDAWSEIWHSRNDGSGSGLDADLLDGNHASAFATSGHTHSYLSTSGGTVSGTITTNYIKTNSYSISAPRWDCSFYVLQSQHWYGQDGSQRMYLGEAGNTIDCRGFFDATGIYASSTIHANSYIRSDNGIGNVLISGTDQDGAVYFAGANNNGSTGAIEASWNNSLRPQIAIGVTRDSNNTKAIFTYHGWGALYANNTERFYWDTGGFRLSGTQYSSSTIRLKENIREANLDSLGVIADADESFDKWTSMHTVVFDWKEKPTDPIWVGCNEHSNRIECEASDCLNSKTELVEHECGNGWCYGTAEDPCPRYRGVRDVVGWIAEEVREIYGDKMVGYSEDRVIESINMTALHAEHVNVTQHLIKYVRELEQRIAELETV